MILDSVEPIDLSVIFELLLTPVVLDGAEVGQGRSIIDSPGSRAGIDDALDGIVAAVEARSAGENQARRGLCWLLDRDDDALADLLARGGIGFPGSAIGDRRRYLELLWDRVFADWRVVGFDPDRYRVVGLPE